MAKNTFKVAGITVHNGNIKTRFTDDLVRRIKQFTKGGASRIELVELPAEMTKLEALKFMQTHELFQNPSDQATIADAISDREKDASKGEVKVKASKTQKPSLDAIKARAKKIKNEVTVEQILDSAELHNVDPA